MLNCRKAISIGEVVNIIKIKMYQLALDEKKILVYNTVGEYIVSEQWKDNELGCLEH